MPIEQIIGATNLRESTTFHGCEVTQSDDLAGVFNMENQMLGKNQNDLMNNQPICNFLEAVHIEQHPEDVQRVDTSTALDLEMARDKAEKSIVDAEHFRAMLEQPPPNRYEY